MELENKSYQELKKIAKNLGIKPNQKREQLIKEISDKEKSLNTTLPSPIKDEIKTDIVPQTTPTPSVKTVVSYPEFKSLVVKYIVNKTTRSINIDQLFLEYSKLNREFDQQHILNWVIQKSIR